jgi:glycosyltransferase involved in cell wall biosynthesis
MAMPLVSVVVPAYNAERTIRRAIDSVFAQSFAELEVVVCDDGSSDGTGAILAEYGSRLRVITQANRGRGAARNACLLQSRGELVAMLDADDWWMPGKTAAQVEAAQRNPEAGVFYGNAYIVNGSGQIYRSLNGEWHVGHSGWVFPFLVRQNFVPMPTVMVRRSAVDQAGLFDETLRRSQDLEWLLRLAAITTFEYSPAMLASCDDHNWSTAEKRLDTYQCFLALLGKIEARHPQLAHAHRHAFAKSYSDCESELARFHEEQGQFAEAAVHYDRALAHTPRSRVLRRRRALAIYRSGTRTEARRAMAEALDDDPYDAEARFYLGTLRLAEGELTCAREQLETALYDGYLYQKFPECLNNLAVACARLGEPARALELVEQALAQQTFYSDAIRNRQVLREGQPLDMLTVTPRKVFS